MLDKKDRAVWAGAATQLIVSLTRSAAWQLVSPRGEGGHETADAYE